MQHDHLGTRGHGDEQKLTENPDLTRFDARGRVVLHNGRSKQFSEKRAEQRSTGIDFSGCIQLTAGSPVQQVVHFTRSLCSSRAKDVRLQIYLYS